MQDEPLTPEEQAALAALRREASPPPHLEDRVVAGLRDAGALRLDGSGSTLWRRWLLRAVAAVVLLASGVVLGRATMGPSSSPGSASYLLLLYGDASLSGKSEQLLYAEYAAWADGLRNRRQLIAAERLRPEARVVGDPTATRTPPVGFFLIHAESFEAAAATAAACPHIKYGGTIVVRPTG